MPSFIYPVNKSYYVYLYSYTCEYVINILLSPEPMMTSSASVHWRYSHVYLL